MVVEPHPLLMLWFYPKLHLWEEKTQIAILFRSSLGSAIIFIPLFSRIAHHVPVDTNNLEIYIYIYISWCSTTVPWYPRSWKWGMCPPSTRLTLEKSVMRVIPPNAKKHHGKSPKISQKAIWFMVGSWLFHVSSLSHRSCSPRLCKPTEKMDFSIISSSAERCSSPATQCPSKCTWHRTTKASFQSSSPKKMQKFSWNSR